MKDFWSRVKVPKSLPEQEQVMTEPTTAEISIDWKWRQSLIDAEYDFTGSNHLAEAHRHLKIALDRLEAAEDELAIYNQDGMERVNDMLKEIPVIVMANKLEAAEQEAVELQTALDAMTTAAGEIQDQWQEAEQTIKEISELPEKWRYHGEGECNCLTCVCANELQAILNRSKS